MCGCQNSQITGAYYRTIPQKTSAKRWMFRKSYILLIQIFAHEFLQNDNMKQTQITDTIAYIEPSGVAPNLHCAALVLSSNPGIVIDLNLAEADTEAVLREIQPERAYLTHYHLDHSCFWQEVQKHSSADFYIPRGEEAMLSDTSTFLKETPGEFGDDELWRLFIKMAGYKEIKTYRVYDDNHRFQSGVSTIECIRTAGHSPSHTSFYLPSERILFAGDLGFNRFGPWYGWKNCDIPSYIESLLRLSTLKTETLLTSHEGIIRKNLDAVWDSCLSHFLTRERSIRKQLDSGKTQEEIAADGIYFTNKERVDEPMKTVITLWDRMMLKHHLSFLESNPLEKLFPQLAKKQLLDGR
jgi:hydroxyacylglutathione hydrolase